MSTMSAAARAASVDPCRRRMGGTEGEMNVSRVDSRVEEVEEPEARRRWT